MEIQTAQPEDVTGIQTTAEQSFQTSYSLSPDQIRSIVETEFSEEKIEKKIESGERDILVSQREDEEVLGFVDIETDDDLILHWLHVDPGARGEGIGSALVEEAQQLGDDQQMIAHILQEAREGSEFLERFGLRETDSDQADIGGESFHYRQFTPGGQTHDANEPSVTVPETVIVDGDELFLDREEQVPAIKAPFYKLYVDTEQDEEYGFFCSECGSTAVMTSGMGRLGCKNCGNLHRPDEYDSAYL